VRGEGDLGLGDLAAGLGEALAGAEAAAGAPEELARPVVVAELGHGDAAQGEGRRVVAQCDTLEGAEGITGRQRARGRGDEGVHVWKDAPDLGERVVRIAGGVKADGLLRGEEAVSNFLGNSWVKSG
jgi:hypothetical protein